MARRSPKPAHLAARARARRLLDDGADDACVAVLGVLLRAPAAAVTPIELRAECPELDGPRLAHALEDLLAAGLVWTEHVSAYGLAYRVTAERPATDLVG